MSEHVDCRVCSAPLLVARDSVRFYDPDGRSKHWSEGSLKQIHPIGDIIDFSIMDACDILVYQARHKRML